MINKISYMPSRVPKYLKRDIYIASYIVNGILLTIEFITRAYIQTRVGKRGANSHNTIQHKTTLYLLFHTANMDMDMDIEMLVNSSKQNIQESWEKPLLLAYLPVYRLYHYIQRWAFINNHLFLASWNLKSKQYLPRNFPLCRIVDVYSKRQKR